MQRRHNDHPLFWRWILWLVLAVAILAAGLRLECEVGMEGSVREGLCRELLAGHTAGRQGMVSSVWWGPFPTLATLPVAFLLPEELALPACLVVSALFGAAMLVLIEQALRMWGAGRWRWVLMLAAALNPSFLRHCWSGSSAPMALCLLVLSLYSITAWVAGRRLRDLVWFGLGGALLLGTAYEMSGWMLAAVCVLAVEEWRRRVCAGEKGAVLVLALLPAGYTAALWLLMCWLIMGDPLYAVRSLTGAGPGPGGVLILPDVLWWSHAGLAAMVVWMLALSLRRHDRSGVCLAVLALALPGAAGLLAWRERLWDAAPLLLALLPASILALGHWMAIVQHATESEPREAGARIRTGFLWLMACLPLVLADAAPLLLDGGAAGGLPWCSPPAACAAAPAAEWLPLLEQHVRRRSPFSKVFAAGYESFALLERNAGPIFEHALDFNQDKVKRDYHGHVLYLLVRRPEQRHAMDSIHWKHPDIYLQGVENALYDSDWGDWRLFELIQASAPR
jgi:hypothetical protein